jgi:hypothetical protein
MPSLLSTALKSIPLHFAGAASGVYSTFQQTASALGGSIIGGIFYFFVETQRDEPSLAGIYYSAFTFSAVAQIVCLFWLGAFFRSYLTGRGCRPRRGWFWRSRATLEEGAG